MTEKTKQPKSRLHKRIERIIIAGAVITGLLLYNQFYIRSNFREVIDDTVYRSAQPSEKQLRDWIDKYDIKTIVNFRSPEAEMGPEEIAITGELGVDLHFIQISAYEIIPFDKLAEFIDILDTCDTPILLHCRQGMDRSGTASAIAAWNIGKQTYSKAKWHSFIPPGPWKRKAKKDYGHISDIFGLYEKYCDENQLDRDDFSNFRQWAHESSKSINETENAPETN